VGTVGVTWMDENSSATPTRLSRTWKRLGGNMGGHKEGLRKKFSNPDQIKQDLGQSYGMGGNSWGHKEGRKLFSDPNQIKQDLAKVG
jgi:hypothetical protein